MERYLTKDGLVRLSSWIKGIVANLMSLIQELQMHTAAPTERIGTVEHSMNRYPICTLHRTERAAGIGGAGEGGAGGGITTTLPAIFEFDKLNKVTVVSNTQHTAYTEIHNINCEMFGFIDHANPENLTSLLLILR